VWGGRRGGRIRFVEDIKRVRAMSVISHKLTDMTEKKSGPSLPNEIPCSAASHLAKHVIFNDTRKAGAACRRVSEGLRCSLNEAGR